MDRREFHTLFGVGVGSLATYEYIKDDIGPEPTTQSSSLDRSDRTATPTPRPTVSLTSSFPTPSETNGINRTVLSTPDEQTVSIDDLIRDTPTPAPSYASETTDIPSNSLPVFWFQQDFYTHHFTQYSFSSAKVKLYPELLNYSGAEQYQVVVLARPYPEVPPFVDPDELIALGRSLPFLGVNRGSPTEVTVSLEVFTVPTYPFQFVAFLAPQDTEIEDLSPSDVELICESDRLRIENGLLKKARHTDEQPSLHKGTYSRVNTEGCYLLTFSGATLGRTWEIGFVAYKSAYLSQSIRMRDPAREAYVQRALESGLADTLGEIISEEAARNGFTEKREKAEFAIEFVQSLPYIPDDVGTGYNDYTKSVLETLVEAGGDCEDTSILMASILESHAFNYDAVLLLLPRHMAVAVYGSSDISGSYYQHNNRRYYYIETTYGGWDVGEMPEEYRGTSARIYDV